VKDVIVVGAGLGGLMAAAKLARKGRKVLVLEKKSLPGGTSYVFRRDGYSFPMGPLSFSFPGRVRGFLGEAGITDEIVFRPSGFALRTPFLDIVMSRPLAELRSGLAAAFPGEAPGLAEFFKELAAAIDVSRDMDLWHPDFEPGPMSGPRRKPADPGLSYRAAEVRRLSGVPAAGLLDRLLADVQLKNFLGSMGSARPEMSMLNLALMWNIMAGEGIWFPVCGVHGLADILRRKVREQGGQVRLGEPVRAILVRNGRAAGVRTAGGEVIEARAVVSNADYKTTFLELLEPAAVPGLDLQSIRSVPYTESEFCVYLGVDPGRADLGALRSEHLFYRKEIRAGAPGDLEDFDDREFEICHWSGQFPDLAPAGRAALVMRTPFPYGHFAAWRTGDKARTEGYSAFKMGLARKLVRTAETILPGLSGAVEVLEAATPLTYRDWGGRYEGSIAGWSWDAREPGVLPGKILVRTPVPGLFAAGAYAASELFLGGVPTALYTGSLAADLILAE